MMKLVNSTCSIALLVLLCLSLEFPSTKAHAGNCSDSHKLELLRECAQAQISKNKDVEVYTTIFRVGEGEEIYKDPLTFVEEPMFCNYSQEIANYTECSIGVFELCPTNTSVEGFHADPTAARKAVETFCAELKSVIDWPNQGKENNFKECVDKRFPKGYKCITKYIVGNSVSDDVCAEHMAYTSCMSRLDYCATDGPALFTHWAQFMTPKKCPGNLAQKISVSAFPIFNFLLIFGAVMRFM